MLTMERIAAVKPHKKTVCSRRALLLCLHADWEKFYFKNLFYSCVSQCRPHPRLSPKYVKRLRIFQAALYLRTPMALYKSCYYYYYVSRF